MSTVKIEPFSFDIDEGSIQIKTEQLPSSLENNEETEKSKKQEKNSKKEEKDNDDVGKNGGNSGNNDENVDSNDNNSPHNFFDTDNVDEENQKKVDPEEINYKAFADYFIESGIWKDFEGREELEYNEETFQALWKAQAENIAKEYIEEERSQFGNAANQLIDYLKSGGTVDDFVSNYTQQLEVSSIDISDESGQEKVIKEYYKSLNWSDAKIRKHIERLKDSGETEFKEEAEDCKNKLVEAIEEERARMIQEQEEIAKDRRLRIEAFNKAVRNEIYKDQDLAEREKKDLDKFVYEYKYQDEYGNKYSEFMVKMNEINQDPKKYQKFIKFVKNIDSFENKKVVEKQVTKSTFNFLKKGSNPLEGAESAEMVKNKSKGSPPAFKFK